MKKQEKAMRALPTLYWAYEKQPRKVHATEIAYPVHNYTDLTYLRLVQGITRRMYGR